MLIRLRSNGRAISPIIATLLLVLIAIGAGIVVYAYVAGYITNSTTNTGTTINSLSIDYLLLQSSPANAKIPVTAYVRDLGPGAESFNGGMYLRATSFSDILGLSASLTPTGQTPTITDVKIVAVSTTTFQAQVSWSAGGGSGCSISVLFFGTTSTVTCTTLTGALVTGSTSGSVTTSASVSLSYTPSTIFVADTGPISGTSLTSTLVYGLPITTGSFTIQLNTVGTVTMAPAATSSGLTTNPLVSGSTYTVQVTGTDEATTSLSAKSA